MCLSIGENVRLGLDQETYTVVEGQDKLACLNFAQGNFEYPLTFTVRILAASSFTEGKQLDLILKIFYCNSYSFIWFCISVGYRAQLPKDLIPIQQPVTFYPGNTTSQCVSIRAQSDNLYEGPEFAQIRLDRPEHVTIDPRFAPIEITDTNGNA